MTDSSPMQSQPQLPDYLKGLRQDSNNRFLCHATKRDGTPCNSPAIKGARVCRMHGGGSPSTKRKAQLRLAELVNPAIATLAREMTNADRSQDRQRAANSILDRAGVSRVSKLETADAREILVQRLLDLREERAAEEAAEIEDAEIVDALPDTPDPNPPALT